ncbi:MAG TPA: DUF349 domain-containing protein [Pseudonocardiaceae bacterium]|jgi:hypothetical protein|nr:DUF349 domain-containing protein [Pseudonocardiaceae bacterium]
MAEEHTVNGASAPGDTVRPGADAQQASEPIASAEPTQLIESAEPAVSSVEPPAESPVESTAVPEPAQHETHLPTEVARAKAAEADAPAAAEQEGAVPPPAQAETHPDKWGRVDAEGTVYVRTADGERAVGSWQAGEPVEGLVHYARRFDDMRTEVELLHARLASGSGDPKQAATSAKHLLASIADAAVVGDLAALAARTEYIIAEAERAIEAHRKVRDAARAESAAHKQTLVEEAEKIAEEATQWKPAGDRLRAILDEWKTIKGVDRKTDEVLWKRFAKARDAFNRRRGSHFADMDRQRGAARAAKQALVDEAEQIADSEDWTDTANRYKQLMVDWKAAGRAPKESDDALWQRFRAAQDKFFSRRSAVFDERDAEFADNAKRKEDLLAEAASIDPATDLDGARAALHRIQDQWDQIGKVPRERIRELEGKLRAVEEKVRSAADTRWRRTDPEAEARAAQFRERVAQFEAQAAKAKAAGDKRRAEQAEAQAAQWREWLSAAEQALATR